MQARKSNYVKWRDLSVEAVKFQLLSGPIGLVVIQDYFLCEAFS